MTTSRDQVERGFNRFLQNMTDRLPSLQQARTEMNVLTAKIEGLEALVAELTQARAGADATKPATPPKE